MKHRLFTILLLVLGLAAILIWSLFLLFGLEATMLELNQSSRKAEVQELALLQWKEWHAESAREREQLDQAFVTEETMPDLLKKIEDLAKSSHLESLLLTDATLTTEENPRLKSGLSVVGSWTNILSFISALGDLPEKIVVTGANFYQEEKSWRGTATVELWSYEIKK